MLCLGHDYLLLHSFETFSKEDVLSSLLAVSCNVLEDILEMMLASASCTMHEDKRRKERIDVLKKL
jgi:hypothetical protein